MAAYEILLLNTAIPQIQAAQSGDTYVVPRDIAFSTVANLANGTNLLPSLTFSSDTNTGIYREGADALGFTAGGGTNQMVLTTTGLGIGTNNPTSKLAVQDQALFEVTGVSASVMALQALNTARTATVEQRIYGSDIALYTGAAGSQSRNVVLNSSGNLGLGVTPKTDWNAGYNAIQLGGGSSLSGNTSTSLNFTVLASNQYINTAGTSKFINDGYAPRYLQRGDTGEHYWYTTNSGLAGGNVTNTQAMTLDASGNLLVGATSNAAITGFSGSATGQAIQGGLPVLALVDSDDTTNYVTWLANSGGTTYLYSKHSSSPLIFGAANTERARITSGGYFKASNTGAYTGISSSYHEFYQTADSVALFVRATNGSYTSSVLEINGDRATTNATYNLINAYNGPISGQFIVRDSGNAVNTTGTYGTISDQKLKQDIVDAGSQWADIKAVRFRKFKMKNDSTGLLQLGVVAQELEQTSPGLVEEHTDRDREGNDLGTTTKSVKTSVLLMKAAVALQEAMARIEKLEAEVAALKGA